LDIMRAIGQATRVSLP